VAGAVASAVAAVACVVGCGSLAWSQTRHLLHERDLWETGTRTEAAHVEGTVTSHDFVLKEYHLEVMYPGCADVCSETLEFDTLGPGADEGPTKVRFDPRRPHDFALNVALDASGARWSAIGFWVVGGALLGLVLFFVVYRLLRQVADARRAVADGVEEVCRIVSVTQQRMYGKPTGSVTYRIELPESYRSRGKLQHDVYFTVKHGKPLTVNGESIVVLVPRSGAPRPLALREDLYPVVVGLRAS
jgi:hypothetical protein